MGIDFGTTFSSCAVVKDGRMEFVKEAQTGRYSFPSCVFWNGKEFVIGIAAERQSVRDPSRMARWFKRNLGEIEPIMLGDASFQVEELICEILKFFRREAAEILGYTPKAVVLSHPATYQEYLREKLRSAAIMAGFEWIRLIEEPVAAAQGFIHDEMQRGIRNRFKPGQTLLVYDLGGGTFDASLYKVTASHNFEITHTPVGDPRCGGVDFNEAILGELKASCGVVFEKYFERQNQDVSAHRFRATTLDEIIAMKHELSEVGDSTYASPIDGIKAITITRERYEELIHPYIQRSVDLCLEMIAGSGIESSSLAAALLIGGSSRTPMVSRYLEHALKTPVLKAADMDLAVCRGAAIWGARERDQQVLIQRLGLETDPGELTPGEYQSMLDQAGKAYGDQQFTLAEAMFRKLWIFRRNDPWTLFGIGLCQAQMKRPAEALDALDMAATMDPKNASIHWGRGVALLELGKAEEATEAHRKALVLAPGHAGAVQELKRINYMKSNGKAEPEHSDKGAAGGSTTPPPKKAVVPPPFRVETTQTESAPPTPGSTPRGKTSPQLSISMAALSRAVDAPVFLSVNGLRVAEGSFARGLDYSGVVEKGQTELTVEAIYARTNSRSSKYLLTTPPGADYTGTLSYDPVLGRFKDVHLRRIPHQ